MASRRFIDQGFWTCRELNQCSARARLLAIYIFSNETDDYGRAKDDVYRFRHGCFPDEQITDADVTALVDSLEATGFLARYESRDGRPLLWIRNFISYQPMGYRAKPRLDQHPDDPHPIYAKNDKPTDKFMPVGRIRESSEKFREVPEKSENVLEVPSPTPIPIPIPIPSVKSPPSDRPLTGDVLSFDDVAEVTTGMILGWKRQHDNFRAWPQLCKKIIAVDKSDPITLLAHIVEIDNSPRIRNKPATLLKRLSPPVSGTKRRAPADKWQAKAKELLNGTVTRKERKKREKSQPEEIGAILGDSS